jgi:hypothetical protein
VIAQLEQLVGALLAPLYTIVDAFLQKRGPFRDVTADVEGPLA